MACRQASGKVSFFFCHPCEQSLSHNWLPQNYEKGCETMARFAKIMEIKG
jgi:hypothetical protein